MGTPSLYTVSQRFAQHRGYVNNYQKHKDEGKRTEPTGEHFNKPGHSGVIKQELCILCNCK